MNNLAAILDNIDAGVYVSDPNSNKLLFANAKILEQCGLTLPEAQQKPCWEVVRGSLMRETALRGRCEFCPCGKLLSRGGLRDGVRDGLPEGLPGGLPEVEEIVWESHEACAGRIFRNASRMIEWSGTVHAAHLCFITDITESKRLHEHNNKLKSEFLSRVSHEILTPMNAVVGMTRIASASDDIKKVRRCLAKIDDASMQLLEIIKSIMDLSRLEHGRLTLMRRVFSPARMLMGLCEEIEALTAEKSQTLTVNIGEDLPGFLNSDANRLRQILYNLLTNAVKFTPSGGKIGLCVSVGGVCLAKMKADISFSVSDSGIGISEDEQERLFSAFEQSDGSHSRTYGGLGLGLTIAARLARLFGGEIALKSELGKGSVFSFNIIADIAESGHSEVMPQPAVVKPEQAVAAEPAQATGGEPERVTAVEPERVTTAEQESETAKSRQQTSRAGNVFSSFMPTFDVASAMRVLRGNKKLYATMLRTLKANTQFGELRTTLRQGDAGAIVKLLQPLTGISKNLCLSEMSEILVKINTMVRYHVIPEALCNRYDSVMDDIYGNLDKLTDMLTD